MIAAIVLFLAAAIAACLAALIISLLKIREEVKRREDRKIPQEYLDELEASFLGERNSKRQREIRGDTEERICMEIGYMKK